MSELLVTTHQDKRPHGRWLAARTCTRIYTQGRGLGEQQPAFSPPEIQVTTAAKIFRLARISCQLLTVSLILFYFYANMAAFYLLHVRV